MSSATFKAAAKALSDDPVLFEKVRTAGSAEERAAHLRDAGIAVPTHADVNSHMADVAGGQSSSYGPGMANAVASCVGLSAGASG